MEEEETPRTWSYDGRTGEDLQYIWVQNPWNTRGRGGKGYCVFATVPISFGSPVCEYKGTYVSRKVAKSVAQCYVFDFTHNNRAVSIDATTHLGTFGWFISHSRDSPNLVCQKVKFSDNCRPHLVILRHSRYKCWRRLSLKSPWIYTNSLTPQKSHSSVMFVINHTEPSIIWKVISTHTPGRRPSNVMYAKSSSIILINQRGNAWVATKWKVRFTFWRTVRWKTQQCFFTCMHEYCWKTYIALT
jgi:hypothetical protein